MEPIIIEGEYALNTEPPYQKYAAHAIPGTFPRRYWDVIFTEGDEEGIAAYLSGQEPFTAPEPEPEPMHLCKRCKRPCKARYAHCYRCSQYLQKKARIAQEIA